MLFLKFLTFFLTVSLCESSYGRAVKKEGERERKMAKKQSAAITRSISLTFSDNGGTAITYCAKEHVKVRCSLINILAFLFSQPIEDYIIARRLRRTRLNMRRYFSPPFCFLGCCKLERDHVDTLVDLGNRFNKTENGGWTIFQRRWFRNWLVRGGIALRLIALVRATLLSSCEFSLFVSTEFFERK